MRIVFLCVVCDMGATLAVITMGAFIMYQLRGKKKK